MRLSDKDFQFVKDDVKWVKYSLVFVTIYLYNILMFNFKADVDNKIVNSFISIMVLIKLINLLSIITV